MPPDQNPCFYTSLMKWLYTYHSISHCHKLASNLLYWMKSHNKLDMAVLMKRELHGADLSGVSLFIDYIFPNHVLPFTITQELLGQLTNNKGQLLYNQPMNGNPNGEWVGCPNFRQKTEECHMTNWLNLVCTRLSQIDTLKMLVSKRICSSHFATKPLGGVP